MKSKVQYCQYIVCMMDLLGQKKMYERLEQYPIGNSDPEFQEQIIYFIRSIEYFKRDVESFFIATEKYESTLEWSKDAKDYLLKFNNNLCKIQRFSDGILVYVPLAETRDSYPISSVLNALLCTASTMLISLAKQNPIRVGIGIGGGVELEDGELFGPAIGYAHEMESKRAIYPRIAIHENVINYLNLYDPPKIIDSTNIDLRLETSISELCKSAIKLDFDGEYFLDYLGDHVWQYIFRGGDNELLKKAFEFVSKEKMRFESDGDTKLLDKYSYLYSYFINSRYEIFNTT